MRPLNRFESTICKYTGTVFCLAKRDGYDVVDFIQQFMNCKVPAILDTHFYRYAGCGPNYLYAEALDEFTPLPDTGGNARYGEGVLDWAGYYYRAWNWLTGEPSKRIVEICPAQIMLDNWFYGHTVDVALFVDDMHQSYDQCSREK